MYHGIVELEKSELEFVSGGGPAYNAGRSAGVKVANWLEDQWEALNEGLASGFDSIFH